MNDKKQSVEEVDNSIWKILIDCVETYEKKKGKMTRKEARKQIMELVTTHDTLIRQRFYEELVERVDKGERKENGDVSVVCDNESCTAIYAYNDALDRVKQIALEISKK